MNSCMERKTTILFYTYLVIGILALMLSWIHTPSYFDDGVLLGNVSFWQDALLNSNPANKFLLIDLFFLCFAANVWMVIESRRIGIKYVWVYISIGILIAISFAFPLFLAARERQLSLMANDACNVKVFATDIAGLGLLFVVVLSVGVWLL